MTRMSPRSQSSRRVRTFVPSPAARPGHMSPLIFYGAGGAKPWLATALSLAAHSGPCNPLMVFPVA